MKKATTHLFIVYWIKLNPVFFLFLLIMFSFNNLYSQNATIAGNIVTSNTTIYDRGGTGDYSNNTNEWITIVGKPGVTINIAGNYNTENNYDYIYIRNGYGNAGTIRSTVTNSGSINYTGLAGETLTVHLTSDGSATRSGFQFTVTYSTAQVALNVVNVSGTSGVGSCGTDIILKDHGGDGDYAANRNDYYILPAGALGVINISGSYRTENNWDFVRIYDGSGIGGAVLATYTNSGTINYTGAAGQTLTISFTSDGSNQSGGFAIVASYTGSCTANNIGWTGASGTNYQPPGSCGNWSANWCAGSGTYSYLSLTQGINYTVENIGGTSCSGTALPNAYLQAWWEGGATTCGWGAIPNYGLNTISFNAQISGNHIINVTSSNTYSDNGCGQSRGHDFSGSSAVLRYRQNTTVTNTSSNGNICQGSTKSLTATLGGTHNNPTITYTVIPGTGTGTISGSTFTATAAGTVTVRATVGNCSSDVDFTIIGTPSATITSTSSTICHGNTVTLSGTVSSGGTVNINNGVGAATTSGTTWTTIVTPTATTTYAISSVTNGGCTGTGSGSTTVTLPTAGTTLSGNGESATCIVNGTNIINFYHSSGRLIASINPNGENLGSVTATSYVDAGLAVPACDDPTNPNYVTATMGRHWVITPTNQPVAPATVLVGLPFSPSEYNAVAAASMANTNPNDNLASIASLKLSKYSGTNEDALFSNNCGNGVTTLWNQSSSGLVNSYNPTFNGTDQYAAFSVTSFSEFWLHGQTSSPLPVKLTNFSATCEKVVTLNWTTASEQNSDRFIVEKSRDGQTWSWVATQTAAGTSNTIINYTQTDENNWNGVTYYRLRQIDFNGEEEIYGPISVSCEGNESSMTVYPNPNSGSFTIEIASTEMYNDAQLFLTDLTGKVISSQKVNVANGTTQILINDLDLKMGTYLVTLRGADQQLKPVKVMVTK